MTNKVDTSLWDIEAKQHSKRVYFNKPQLLTQYIGAKTTVIAVNVNGDDIVNALHHVV